MLSVHRFLDKYLKKRLSFSVFFRIWLALAFLIAFIGLISFYALQKTIRPSAKRVVEDTLVDTSRLLAALVADDVAQALDSSNHNPPKLRLNFQNTDQHTPLWYDKKTISQFHLYITNAQGVVIYDSFGRSLGADFSRWNDVYLTLKGKYGARSSDDGTGSSVMYVASPIVYDDKLIGVLSVGKPTNTLTPYLDVSRRELGKILLQSMLFSLGIALLIAMWLRHSIEHINRYTQSLANAMPPYFYLANELNELVANIKTMKDTIENRAYVSEYVHTLTHELKSPLAAIRASSELLGEEMQPNERAYFSRLIGDQTMRLSLLIDKLLMLAKLEQPTFVPTFQSVYPEQIASDCLDNQAAQIDQKNLLIFKDKIHKSPIQADAFWLNQAIQNLVDNAITHSSSFVAVFRSEQSLWIINDSTVLPDYVLKRAFERYFSFYQDNQTKGTGLGLPLVAQVMQHHKGDVKLYQTTLDDFCANLQPQKHATLLAFLTKQPPKTNLIILSLNFDNQST